MKNYANRKETDLFMYVLAFEQYLNLFEKCEFISDVERRKVNNALKNIKELSKSVQDRLGVVFLKKIKSNLECNTLGFYAKGILRDKVANNIDDSVLDELLEDAGWNMDCFDCNKENHTQCRCYRLFVEMGKDGNDTETGCPFKF